MSRGGRSDPAEGSSTLPGRCRRAVRLLAFAGVAAVILIAATAGAAVYTERPSFCPTCHEMGPYYDAWATGTHARTSCIACHVEPGFTARALHKLVALKEVWNHFTKTNVFPTYAVKVPDSRCLPCHGSVEVTGTPAFSHAAHERKASCASCHYAVGHDVSPMALRAAGVLATGSVLAPIPAGLTPSTIPGHRPTSCSRCHDMGIMECFVCHKAKHADLGPCLKCHVAGPTWVFVHPADQDCAACHKPPAGHFGPPCTSCHRTTVPFARAVFRHPGTGQHGYRAFPCAKCHPRNYSAVSCTCHGGAAPRGD